MSDTPPEVAEAIDRHLARAPRPDEYQLAIVARNVQPPASTPDDER